MAALAALAPQGAFASARRARPSFDPATADASAMAAALATGAVLAHELVEIALARLAVANPRLNAASFVHASEARAAARLVSGNKGGRAGLLAGIPTFTKDIVEEKGRPYTRGSRAFASRMGTADSPQIAALRASGLILLGRTTTPEFGLLPTTEPLLGGPTRNPWNPDYSAGGSSGGAGALVAAGVVPVAHASDGGGSIRIPASMNGLVGLKPSRGRMSGEEGNRGVTALSVHGCVSRSVRDTAAWLAAHESRAGPHAPVGLVTSPASHGLRIGLRPGSAEGLPHADVLAVFEESRLLLQRMGHKTVDAPFPYDAPAIAPAFETIWGLGAARDIAAASAHLGREAGPGDIEPASFGMAAIGAAASKADVASAIATLEDMAARYNAQFDAFDILMTPVLGTPPPALGLVGPDVPFETLQGRLRRLVGYTPVENAAGACAISLPLGMSGDGLPIGLQFTAPPGQERRLLELALGIEAARPWADRRPRSWVA